MDTDNNVSDQGFGGLPNPNQPITVTRPADIALLNEDGGDSSVERLSVNQPVTTQTPSSLAVIGRDGGDSSVKALSVDQPVTVQVPGEPLLNLNGDLFRGGGVPNGNGTQNNVADQVYGIGSPSNVFV